MLRPLIQRPQRSAINRPRERGVTLALVAVAIFSIIAMASLSIDFGTLYQASAEAQRAADAAALAAARVLSSSGLTGDPTNLANTWGTTCADATQMAKAVAGQNNVGGAPPSSVNVTFLSSDGSGCTSGPVAFGVNPMVTVTVSQSSLPTYFSRIWGRTGSSVSATATAEAFNPSNSGAYASGTAVVPVQPRCVKPWIVPNLDPVNAPLALVATSNGSITTKGILVDNAGVIGETFWLMPDCNYAGTICTLRGAPQANYPKGVKPHVPPPPSLEYLPGQALYASTAIPSDGTACSTVASAGNYAQAIAGCDQSTQYQCGKPLQNVVDLSENPAPADTADGAQCLIHQGTSEPGYGLIPPLSGQDALRPVGAPPYSYPFQIQVGSGNPLLGAGVGSTDLITSSTSIVSLPIYDSSTGTISAAGTTAVTVIGFLQVFINYVNAYGNVNVTVMNVSGCGNAASGTALTGTSPVPVRLITPP
jgi:Flp pilus assembly protein TadG